MNKKVSFVMLFIIMFQIIIFPAINITKFNATGLIENKGSNLIVNGDFSEPADYKEYEQTSIQNYRIPTVDVAGWQGTGEYATTLYYSGYYEGSLDLDGFAGHTYDEERTLFQEFSTIPGETYNITFDHATTGGGQIEIMDFYIGAGSYTTEDFVEKFSSNDGAVKSESYEYVVPAGQTTTRLTFVPRAPEGAVGFSTGNYLDNVSAIQTTTAPPSVIITDNGSSTRVREEIPLTDDFLIHLSGVEATENGVPIPVSEIAVDQSKIDYSTPGIYIVDFSTRGETLSEEIEVFDALPSITTNIETFDVPIGSTAPDYVAVYGASATEIEEGDLTNSITVDSSAVNLNTAGQYDVIFSVKDEEGNNAEKTVVLNVTNAPEPVPTITANETAEIAEEKMLTDEELIELFNVSAADADSTDITEQVVVDKSQVSVEPGQYPVVFTIPNTSVSKTVQLTVKDVLPKINTQSNEITIGLLENITDYVSLYGAIASEITEGDLNGQITTDATGVTLGVPGTYTVKFSVMDEEGNVVQENVTLNIKNQKPVLTGKENETILEEKELTDKELITLFNTQANDSEDGDLTSEIKVDQSKVDYSTPGEYEIKFSATDKNGEVGEYVGKLEVEDVLPVINTEKEYTSIVIGSTLTDYIQEYGTTASEIVQGDLTGKIEVDASQIDYSTPGTYKIMFSVKDEEGNRAQKEVELIITNEKPQLVGEKSVKTPEEKELTDEELITLFNTQANDLEDGDLTSEIKVDQSKVDYSTPGEYEIKFSATDKNGEVGEYVGKLEVEDVLPVINTEKDEVTIKIGSTLTDYIQEYGTTASEIVQGDLTGKIEVDASQIDYSTPGTYKIIFSVKDEEDNQVQKEVKLKITEEKTTDKTEGIQLAKTGKTRMFKIK